MNPFRVHYNAGSIPQGLKPSQFWLFPARLKSCPVTKQFKLKPADFQSRLLKSVIVVGAVRQGLSMAER
jgi:hypothetical protein